MTDKEDRQREKRRRKRRRQDKRREKIHFQCGAWQFFADGVLFLFGPVCARDLCLLNSVKDDSTLSSFSASWQVNSFFSGNYLFSAVTVFNFFELFTYAVTVSKKIRFI